jgi:hypothetical protein
VFASEEFCSTHVAVWRGLVARSGRAVANTSRRRFTEGASFNSWHAVSMLTRLPLA